MLKIKKNIWRNIIFVIVSIVIMISSVTYSDAASAYKKINSKTKVGSYYIWVDGQKGLYTMKSGSTKKLIVKKPSQSNTDISYTVISNGNKIYYSVITDRDDNRDYGKIYRIDVTGKNKKIISTIPHLNGLQGYFNGKLYIGRHDVTNYGCDHVDISTYYCNINNGKYYLIKKHVIILSQNNNYLILRPLAGDYGPLPIYCYNANTNKSYKITSYGGTVNFVNGKIYYSYIKDTYTKKMEILKSCSYTGKNQKTIKTFKYGGNGGAILSINKTNIEYVKYNKNYTSTFYKYYYNTGKIVKVKTV